MDYTKFVNRREELAFFKKTLSSKRFELIPVWGRRRVGKTALLIEAIKKKKAIYFLANEAAEIENIRHFKDDATRALSDDTIMDLANDWEAIFRYIAPKGITIIIDEFPYLIISNHSIPSVFQRIIDVHLTGTRTKLILCGSSIRMMGSMVLDYKAPLYGRRTGQLKVLPLSFRYLKDMLPDYSFEDLVRVFGACGGIPLYIQQFDPKVDFWKNIEGNMFRTTALLYSEADLLLKQEFTQLSRYKTILNAIAIGKVSIGEIKDHLQETKSDISSYLNNLVEIEILKKMVPVTEDPARSRRGIYHIMDGYLNFNFRYVRPYRSMIEALDTKGVLELVKDDYDRYLGHVFEHIVIEAFFLWSRAKSKVWDNIGPWWYKDEEIDLVALSKDRNEILAGEVKWSRKKIGPKVIEALKEKIEKVRWGKRDRTVKYLMVSRGGFTRSCIDLMEKDGIMYWTCKDLERLLWAPRKGRKKG